MQKRFCSCGHMVLVRYLCNNGVWRPLVLSRGLARKKSAGQTCPACGSPISIHTLR